MMGNRCRISSMETSPLLLALKAVVFLGFVRSPFLFVLDSFLLAYLNFTRSCHSSVCKGKIRTDHAGRNQKFPRNRTSRNIEYEKRLLSTKSRYAIWPD